MAQFKTDYFRFDGILSDRYNLQIVNVNNDGYESSFGIDRSVSSEKGTSKTTPVFYGTEENCPSFEVELFYCDRVGNPLPITDTKAQEMSRWLFKNEPKGLECNGVIYYGVFTNGSKWINSAKQGYFNLTFEMTSSVAWSAITYNPCRVINSKTIEVYNKSTYDEDIYPDIEAEILSGNSVKVTNLTTGQVIEISNMENNEHFRIYNDGVRQVVSLIDSERNLFKLFNKEWLYLRYGLNKLKIEVEDANVNIIHQNKILLY